MIENQFFCKTWGQAHILHKLNHTIGAMLSQEENEQR